MTPSGGGVVKVDEKSTPSSAKRGLDQQTSKSNYNESG